MGNCKQCGEELVWDEKVVSASGKKIPLDKNGQKHNCPFSKFNQTTDKLLGGTPLEVLTKYVKIINELEKRVYALEMRVIWGHAKSESDTTKLEKPNDDNIDWEQYKT